MSIRAEIAARVSEGRLFHLPPAMQSVPLVRCLFLSAEINKLVHGPWDDEEEEFRCGRLRADLDRFIAGRLITVPARVYKTSTAYMVRLEPPEEEVWEIRSVDPQPSLRVFGRFAATNHFVALTWSPRALLGAPGSRAWRDAIIGCKADWRKLFPSYDPIHGASINDYISDRVVLV